MGIDTSAALKVAIVTIDPPGNPYRTFAEISQTLCQAFRALGHECAESDQFYLNRLNVVLGATKLEFTRDLPPRTVIFNFEQISDGSRQLSADYLALLRHYAVWDYSRNNLEALLRLGVRRARLVPIGYVPELTRIPAADEDIDVLFYGAVNERRASVLEALRRRDLRTHVAFGVYGAERDALIARSRIVLNMHYYESRIFEVVRVSYLLANRRFVLSETGGDADLESDFVDGLAWAAYDELPRACEAWLERPQERAQVAERGYRLMRDRPQAQLLRPALDALPFRED